MSPGKKIVVITGSPRKDGNSNAMSNAFIHAAEQLGHTIIQFDAVEEDVGGCKACRSCFKTEDCACTFDGGFNRIATSILDADGIVLSMPVYWYSIPAQIKCVIDKLFSFLVAGKDVSGKACALLSCCQDKDTSVFDGVYTPYKRTAALLKWTCVGEVLVPGVWKVGDIEQTDGCRQAALLAERF